ncbi:MAG TPA: hypothetical protein VGT02_17455 [Methylomirabilota bacterium]|jgi:hypothetical protein|nr:hypothetical protein [Methylomirabilota bacterium]
MTPAITDDYIQSILEVAKRDTSIARVLREICALEGGVRGSALDLVGAHLRATSAAADVLECVQALRRDEVARAIIDRLGPPG